MYCWVRVRCNNTVEFPQQQVSQRPTATEQQLKPYSKIIVNKYHFVSSISVWIISIPANRKWTCPTQDSAALYKAQRHISISTSNTKRNLYHYLYALNMLTIRAGARRSPHDLDRNGQEMFRQRAIQWTRWVLCLTRHSTVLEICH